MHVVMISGSRNEKGRTAQCLDAIGRGVATGGGTSERFFLPVLKIERCRQCDLDGWGDCRRKGICIIEDDFQMLIDNMKNADAVVIASPVYLLDITESMRAFLDRVRRITFMQKENPLRGKPTMLLTLAGGGGRGTAPALATLDRQIFESGFDIVDLWSVRRQNFDVKVPMLEATGKWLATKPTSGPWPPPQSPVK
jgi:multimeric flavodoxin WrbA